MTTTLVQKVKPVLEKYLLEENPRRVGASYSPPFLEAVQRASHAKRGALQECGRSLLHGAFPCIVLRHFPEVLRSQHGMTVSSIFFAREDRLCLIGPPTFLFFDAKLGVSGNLHAQYARRLYRRGAPPGEHNMDHTCRPVLRGSWVYVCVGGCRGRWYG